jgi:septal ring factor EnvC (AmiA/AmiB activator)
MSDNDSQDDVVEINLGSPIDLSIEQSFSEPFIGTNEETKDLDSNTSSKKKPKSSFAKARERMVKAADDWDVWMDQCKKERSDIMERLLQRTSLLFDDLEVSLEETNTEISVVKTMVSEVSEQLNELQVDVREQNEQFLQVVLQSKTAADNAALSARVFQKQTSDYVDKLEIQISTLTEAEVVLVDQMKIQVQNEFEDFIAKNIERLNTETNDSDKH